MIKYAKIENNYVVNLIICEDNFDISLIDGQHVQVTELTGEAYIGAEYNLNKNKFVPQKIYNSWSLNEETLEWEAPVLKPSSGNYAWNEQDQQWVEQVSGITQ